MRTRPVAPQGKLACPVAFAEKMAANKRVRVSKGAVLGDPVCLLAFGLGTGLMPVAPGTFGTLLGIPIYLLLNGTTPATYGLVVGLMFAAGVLLCSSCEKRLGMRDPSGIVWDEIVGVLITLWAVEPTLGNVVLAFLLFRFFDVLKPWPIRALDRSVHGGFGIMLDDVLAGLFGWIVLRTLQPLLV